MWSCTLEKLLQVSFVNLAWKCWVRNSHFARTYFMLYVSIYIYLYTSPIFLVLFVSTIYMFYHIAWCPSVGYDVKYFYLKRVWCQEEKCEMFETWMIYVYFYVFRWWNSWVRFTAVEVPTVRPVKAAWLTIIYLFRRSVESLSGTNTDWDTWGHNKRLSEQRQGGAFQA